MLQRYLQYSAESDERHRSLAVAALYGLLLQHGINEPRAQASGFREFCKYLFSSPPARRLLSWRRCRAC